MGKVLDRATRDKFPDHPDLIKVYVDGEHLFEMVCSRTHPLGMVKGHSKLCAEKDTGKTLEVSRCLYDREAGEWVCELETVQ